MSSEIAAAADGEGTPLRLAVITRLTNDNAGNEALSTVIGRLMAQKFGDANVRLIDRIPTVLQRFDYDVIRKADDPVAAFEATVDKVAKLPTATGPLCPLAHEADIHLIAQPRIRSSLMRWAKRNVRLRSRLRSRGILPDTAPPSGLNTLRWADAVVWNPAGEIHPKTHPDQVMLILLMVRLAQRLGKPVAIVNHSLEAVDPILNRLLIHVYEGAQFVAVREQGSFDRGVELGFPAAQMRIIPDLAFMLSKPGFLPELAEPTATPIPKGSIVLSINGDVAPAGGDGWEKLIAGLREFDRSIVFVSNSMKDDIPFARMMEHHADLEFRFDQPGFRDLVRLYRDASMVISSRLHASIFALCAGVPVISIEPQMFKLTGIFEQLGYPIRTHRTDDAAWAERLLVDARRAVAESESIVEAGKAGLQRQVASIEAGYAPLEDILRSAVVVR